jgi:hypothetical protein
MISKQVACPICGTLAEYESVIDFNLAFYDCGSCGRYSIGHDFIRIIDKDMVASYLLYNCNLFCPESNEDNGKLFFFIGTENTFTFLHKKYPNSRLIKSEDIDNWYPKNFNERVDYILLGLSKLSDYTGKSISVIGQKGNSLL